MRKTSDAVREIIENSPAIRLGLSQRLMNLSQVARHIRAAVEARAQKSVQLPAIAMALSRLQAELPEPGAGPDVGLADRITVQRGLVVLTYPNSQRSHDGLPDLQRKTRQDGGYLTITEGVREITLIVEERGLELVKETIRERPLHEVRRIASISVSLTEEDLTTSGVLYRFLQPLALQGLSLTEVTSTRREFHVYLPEDDVMLALDALYGTFGRS